MSDDEYFPISVAVRESGLTHESIRKYERQQLITPRRDANGNRRYTTENIKQLIEIKLTKATRHAAQIQNLKRAAQEAQRKLS
jgi:DNA-binding transcriptional MerR regulator